NVCGAFDVVGSASSDLVGTEDELFGRPAAEEDDQLPEQPFLGVVVAVLVRQSEGDPQGTAPGNDGHLVDRSGPRGAQGDDGMAGLVIGRETPLFLREHQAATL